MTISQENSKPAGTPQRLECDIVMAGGVTSGIIYPGAVAMISRRYSFRSIGGTSVGAIAAAVTAAAEYGRRTGKNPRAFELIASIPEQLGRTAQDGHSRLFHLFTPQPSTRPLFALVAPLFSGTSLIGRCLRLGAAAMRATPVSVAVTVAALGGAAVVITLLRSGSGILAVLAALMTVASCLVAWAGTILFLLVRKWLPAWRANGYGICTGLSSPGEDDPPFEGLTSWVHQTVQAAAGRNDSDQPLTFGELWAAPLSPDSGSATRDPDPTQPRTVELAMTASDISRNRTVQVPFLETPSPLYFDQSVFERYFPKSIVDWMVRRAGEYDERIEVINGVYRLPRPQDLPLVFGVRLSLSFPILLSAMPLMTPDFAKSRKGDRVPLRRVWLSDGGLTSNFPIHFFDSPIPTRPTFCLNLIDFDAEAPNVETPEAAEDAASTDAALANADSVKAIAQPRAIERTAARRPKGTKPEDPKPGAEVWSFISMAKGNRFSPVPFTSFDTESGIGLAAFLSTLLNTARFWSDNQMLIAPGVRDRVVNIALREDEGGLNLDMTPDVIADLDARGRAAGLLISARFDPAAETDPETGRANEQTFANHRWVRYRNFMAAFEDMSRRFVQSRRASDAAAAERLESGLDAMIDGNATEKLGYPAPKAAVPYFHRVTDGFENLALSMAVATRADDNATFDRPRSYNDEAARKRRGGAPRPKMRARLRPLIDNDPRSETADLP